MFHIQVTELHQTQFTAFQSNILPVRGRMQSSPRRNGARNSSPSQTLAFESPWSTRSLSACYAEHRCDMGNPLQDMVMFPRSWVSQQHQHIQWNLYPSIPYGLFPCKYCLFFLVPVCHPYKQCVIILDALFLEVLFSCVSCSEFIQTIFKEQSFLRKK